MLCRLAAHGQPSGPLAAQFRLRFAGFLLLFCVPRDKVVHSTALLI